MVTSKCVLMSATEGFEILDVKSKSNYSGREHRVTGREVQRQRQEQEADSRIDYIQEAERERAGSGAGPQ